MAQTMRTATLPVGKLAPSSTSRTLSESAAAGSALGEDFERVGEPCERVGHAAEEEQHQEEGVGRGEVRFGAQRARP